MRKSGLNEQQKVFKVYLRKNDCYNIIMNYIGSKLNLLDFIEQTIQDFTKEDTQTFCDIFSGTGVVAKHFKKMGYNVIANDIQYFSYAILKAVIENNEPFQFKNLKESGIKDPFLYLNNLKGRKGFIYNNYCIEGTKEKEFIRNYFSCENAKKIDAIRQKINYWKKNNLINQHEYFYLVASLLESADKVANTASVYEAFLKTLKSSASKSIILWPIDTIYNQDRKSYFATNEDASELLEHISGDILYLDPPYNSRKYDTNYHVLETIALYDAPKIKGKSGIRIENVKKSKFCLKSKALEALEEIIKKAEFKYIFLSYNDEGIITLNEIEKLFNQYGTYKRYEISHRRFKSNNNQTQSKETTIEYIHCLKKV